MTIEMIENQISEIKNRDEFKIVLNVIFKHVEKQYIENNFVEPRSFDQVWKSISENEFLNFKIVEYLNKSSRFSNFQIDLDDLQNEMFSNLHDCNGCGNRYAFHEDANFEDSRYFNSVHDFLNIYEKQFENQNPTNFYDSHSMFGSIQCAFHQYSNRELYCENCADELIICENCDEVIWLNSQYFERNWRLTRDSEQWFCNDCLENRCHWSEIEESWFRWSDNMPENEFDDDDDSDLNLRNWKPLPKFHGSSETNSFFGIELEIEFENSNFNHSETENLLLEISEQWRSGLWYHHMDGSLQNGIELVSHPMSAEFIKNELNLDFVAELRNRGFRSWDTKTCGIHIHIDKRGFDSPIHAYSFANLIYGNPLEWQKMAGRNSTRFASFDPNARDLVSFEIKGKSRQRNRYVAVNCTNQNTFEIRIFRGSLNQARIRSAFELVIGAQNYTRQISIKDIHLGKLQWNHFSKYLIENASEYPNANTYLEKYYGNEGN